MMDDLIPLGQSLISPALANAFSIPFGEAEELGMSGGGYEQMARNQQASAGFYQQNPYGPSRNIQSPHQYSMPQRSSLELERQMYGGGGGGPYGPQFQVGMPPNMMNQQGMGHQLGQNYQGMPYNQQQNQGMYGYNPREQQPQLHHMQGAVFFRENAKRHSIVQRLPLCVTWICCSNSAVFFMGLQGATLLPNITSICIRTGRGKGAISGSLT